MTHGPELAVHHLDDTALELVHRGRPLATYVHSPGEVQLESPRPYLHPVRTLGGELVTVFRPEDHVWHKGISLSLPHVGPHNFWGGPTFVRGEGYRQLPNNGSMLHESFARVDGDGEAHVVEDLLWRAEHEGSTGPVVVRERRELGATVPADDAWVLTFRTRLTNVSGGALDIGSPTTHGRENAGYGGLFWRGPMSFTGGTVLAPGRAGTEELRGERAPWMGFTGEHAEGRASTVLFVDDDANPHHPPQWFVRSDPFACVNPAPFFSEEVAFPDGATLELAYAVVVADRAADPDRAAALADLGGAALAAQGSA
ncbi:hypothetical protein GXB85_09855 [Cellulomonas sp. APG4]|uniref:DUF6807 domain-containing protein n=1 Tax=Cellulomonas sp. APG4 TaxID=1538656 RepID=UPI00137A36C4|nr:PmoA family protein [Cellulomonas sp. APG4]NCT91252.1 hypothetical protein [Cellulomonas sp. APG4]